MSFSAFNIFLYRFELIIHLISGDEWTPCFSLSNPKMPSSPFLGFSALTGEVSESHESVFLHLQSKYRIIIEPSFVSIISVTTSSLILNADLAGVGASGPQSGKAPSSGRGFFGSLFSLLLKLIFLAAVVAVGFVGWRAYGARIGATYGRNNMTWDSKRF